MTDFANPSAHDQSAVRSEIFVSLIFLSAAAITKFDEPQVLQWRFRFGGELCFVSFKFLERTSCMN